MKSPNTIYHTLRAAGLLLSACVICLTAQTSVRAASWVAVTNAPGSAGTMIQLTDGTIMIHQDPFTSGSNWMRLTPNASGNYALGSWSTLAPMSLGRLYFGSQVLQNGKVWVLGGEYSGPGEPRTDTAAVEVYDPVANSWAAAAAYPNQADAPPNTINYPGVLTNGSAIITGIPSTTPFLVGWSVSGAVSNGTTITSIDSSSQVHISNSATNTGTNILRFAGPRLAVFGATPSISVSGGKILAGNLVNTSTFLYNPVADSWAPAASKNPNYNDSSDEEGWVLLPNGNVLNYDIDASINTNGGIAEMYSPAANTWTNISPADGSAGGTLPLLSSEALGHELGAVMRLQDGRVLVIGGNNATALYTPSNNAWAAGPLISGTLNGNAAPFGSDDAPAAILPSGHVIFTADAGPASVTANADISMNTNVIVNIPSTALFRIGWPVNEVVDPSDTNLDTDQVIVSVDSATQIHIAANALQTVAGISLKFGGTFSQPSQIFDFNPAGAGAITPLATPIPDPGLTNMGAFVTRMLTLPTGQVLFSDSTSNLFIYTPDGVPNPALKPVINNIAYNGSGVFTLTGQQLDGQSAGSAYGDDVQQDSNYPILRFVGSTGKVYYNRTTNWSKITVGQSTAAQTVNFTLNPSLPAGKYSAIVSGAGISSFPVTINITQAEVNGL